MEKKIELRYDPKEIMLELYDIGLTKIKNRNKILILNKEEINEDFKYYVKALDYQKYTVSDNNIPSTHSIEFHETEKGYSIIIKNTNFIKKSLSFTKEHLQKRKEGFSWFHYPKTTVIEFYFLSKNGILKYSIYNKTKYLSLETYEYCYKKMSLMNDINLIKKILFIQKNNEWCDKLFSETIKENKFSNQLIKTSSNLQSFINKIKTIDNPISSKLLNNLTFDNINYLMYQLPVIKNPLDYIDFFVKDKQNISIISQEARILLTDTIKMCRELRIKMNFSLNEKNLKKQHDNILLKNIEKFKVADIKVDKKYIELKDSLINFKLIETGHELYYEGLVQKHCVNTYSDSINNGKCAIFTTIYKDNRYTAEIRGKLLSIPQLEVSDMPVDSKIIFYELNQFKGYTNSRPPEELTKKLENLIMNINLDNKEKLFKSFIKNKKPTKTRLRELAEDNGLVGLSGVSEEEIEETYNLGGRNKNDRYIEEEIVVLDYDDIDVF